MNESWERLRYLMINEAKKRSKRDKCYEYVEIKSFLSKPPISPKDIKISQSTKQNILNYIKNVNFSSSLTSLTRSKLKSKPKNKQNYHYKKGKIHQFVPTLIPRDAVGNEVISIQSLLQKFGYDSDILVGNIHPEMIHLCKNYNSIKDKFDADIIIYHHATGTKLLDSILDSKSKIVLIYHNITPSKYFEGINQDAAESSRFGRMQLDKLKNKTSLTFTHSEFSADELRKLGFTSVSVIPYLCDFSHLGKINDRIIKKHESFANILFVGRITPHKKIENIIKVFAYYHKCINSKSNLFIIGNYIGMEKYFKWLQYLVKKARLSNVYFENKLNDEELRSFYQLADVFLCMSEHEGFCVPLVESMKFGVPIIAYNSTAIPDTLDNSGILVNDETPEEIGEIIDLIVNDKNLREKIIQKQYQRLKFFDPQKGEFKFKEEILMLLKNES